MGANSKIEWCHHTFNPWYGCTKVSPACDHCYAEGWAKRSGLVQWGNAPRRRSSVANWRKPKKWNAEAMKLGIRYRVFCASLADVFDNQVPEQWRADLWALIADCPHLDWLLLTKRPQNIANMLPSTTCDAMIAGRTWPWPHVWLGTTVENQKEADRRVPILLSTPAAVRFLSCEPLLGPINLSPLSIRNFKYNVDEAASLYALRGKGAYQIPGSFWLEDFPKIDWVIAGGESGPKARPMHPKWAQSLRDQCTGYGVPFLFKQWGEWAPHQPQPGGDLGSDVRRGRVTVVHPSGQTDLEVFEQTGGRNTIPGTRYVAKIGKKAAGRLLDGVEHNGFPEAA